MANFLLFSSKRGQTPTAPQARNGMQQLPFGMLSHMLRMLRKRSSRKNTLR
jgi:hypothetical protein